uniref:Microfibril associated protein 5 n=1 Tax=Anolis carolinensis TaxID=28377 RepID=A0A803THI4_ANOCA
MCWLEKCQSGFNIISWRSNLVSLPPKDLSTSQIFERSVSLACLFFFPDCHEEQFPCTRLYSVRKPVKQCISYLCVTSIRRTYMINKEICSRIVCKEDEAMQGESIYLCICLPYLYLALFTPKGTQSDSHRNWQQFDAIKTYISK